MRPAFQLSGTGKATEVKGAASHPVGKLGTAVPADRSVYIAGHIVNGHAFTTVNILASTSCANATPNPADAAAIFIIVAGRKESQERSYGGR